MFINHGLTESSELASGKGDKSLHLKPISDGSTRIKLPKKRQSVSKRTQNDRTNEDSRSERANEDGIRRRSENDVKIIERRRKLCYANERVDKRGDDRLRRHCTTRLAGSGK